MAVSGKTRSWEAFNAWCDARGLCAAPANPWTLAVYIRVIEGAMRSDALNRHIEQIGQMHHEKRRTRPDRHAMVQRMLGAVRRREESKKRAKKTPPAPPPLFRDADFIEAKQPKPARPSAKRATAAKKGALSATPKLVRRKRV